LLSVPRNVSIKSYHQLSHSTLPFQAPTYEKKRDREGDRFTFVIFAFLTKTCFLGAILLAPFFGPRTFGLRVEDLAVAVVSFFDLSVPCAIFAWFSWRRRRVSVRMMWNDGRGRERIFEVMVAVEVEGSEIYLVVRALADFDLFLPS
jgi:hypothetical protein